MTPFKRRFRQTQIGHGVLAVIVIALWATVDWSLAGWVATCVGFALAFLALEWRGQKCPHCGGLVLGEISEDAGISLIGGLPAECKTCGRNLA